MDRRRALITGGTGSLGFHAAQAILADDRWEAVITGRRDTAVREAAERLGDRATGARLDLGSLADVRAFARSLPPLDALICNAGLHTITGLRRTADGIEETFAVNHLAHFLLVREALPNLRPGCRVVFVSSGIHDPARHTDFPPPRSATAAQLAHPSEDGEDPFLAGRRRYTESKLCNVLAAYEFARRTPPETATFNVFDPAEMPGTGIAREYRGVRGLMWHRVLPVLAAVPGTGFRTPKRSGADLARLVLDPELAATTGKYFDGVHERRSSEDSYDREKAADLWETSEALTAEFDAGDQDLD